MDAAEELERRSSRLACDDEVENLRTWIERGYVILRGAVSPEIVERVDRDVQSAWDTVDGRVKIELNGVVSSLTPELRGEHYKLVDLYVRSQAALDAAFAAPIRRFLELIFEDELLLFQSLSFERGSEQPIHQDTAYVVVAPPMAFAASWIALEDVQPGSGELAYHPGSHRFPEKVFKGGARNWNRKRDGLEARDQYEAALHTEARAQGIELEKFLPKKGDVLLWSADLAHGGTQVSDRNLSRRSLVSHYCPAQARPYYTTYIPGSHVRHEPTPGCHYSSSHFDLTDFPVPVE